MDYEQLGAFYLGRPYDPAAGEVVGGPVLYDSKDLTTHAVCVGMTGSGKTGLCIGLLEEAALDGVPAIAIDVKGDLGNLLLGFPELRPGDFEPWIDPEAAARQGRTVSEHAAKTAKLWRDGLAQWDQTPERIRRLHDTAEITLFTPGSDAGLEMSLLRSFDAPPAKLLDDAEALRERVEGAVSGLLALLGIEADPLTSREHILIATVLDQAWRAGRGVDLAGLIGAVQSPPFERVGVLDVDAFFPLKDRMALAMRLNNLLASPSAAAWTRGEPVDVKRLLRADDGRPRISIVSIAHLGDAERMAFVTFLLNEVVAWMRAQPGTSSLRALLYMDEVFGYLPPTAQPPSKRPMLTLLKQARAFGLGVVLATQNPVDLDYKALSNAGTWFLGRLQTERDKLRVLDGLEGASAASGGAFDRGRMEQILSGLGSRVFMLHNVHEDEPVLFHTRWVLSYLRGPLTRSQIRKLMASRKKAAPARAASTPTPAPVAAAPSPPAVAAEAAMATVHLHYVKSPAGLDVWREVELEAPSSPSRRKAWEKQTKAELYRERPMVLFKCAEPKAWSEADEDEADFRARLSLLAREGRDLEKERLRAKFAPKLTRLNERIRRAHEKLAREEAQLAQLQQDAALAVGSTLLGALFGRGTRRSATTAARRASRMGKERQDVAAAQDAIAALHEQLGQLEEDFKDAIAPLLGSPDPRLFDVTEVPVAPRKGDISFEYDG